MLFLGVGVMTGERYLSLQHGDATRLTLEEIKEGWHWCEEMDDLLCIIGSSDCFCQASACSTGHSQKTRSDSSIGNTVDSPH